MVFRDKLRCVHGMNNDNDLSLWYREQGQLEGVTEDMVVGDVGVVASLQHH